jgi:Secretion system C-terminal sorting domain
MQKKITQFFITLLCALSFNSNAQIGNQKFEDFFFKTTGVDSAIIEIYDTVSRKMVVNELQKYTYNAQCKTTKISEKGWNVPQKKWFDVAQVLFNYDAQARITSLVTQAYRNAVWVDSARVVYTYTGAATQEASQTSQELVGAVWTNTDLKEFTYTAAKKIATETVKKWDGTAWANISRETNAYDAQNRLSSNINEDWFDPKWVNRARETYSYTAQNKLQGIKIEDWNSSTNTWTASDFYNFTISNNGRKVSYGLDIFGINVDIDYIGTSTGYLDTINVYFAPLLAFRTRFVYNSACQTTATNDLVFLQNAVSISPNPTTDNLTIRLNEAEGDAFSAIIFNASGTTVDVLKWKGKENLQRDVSRLPNGLYFLSVKAEKWQAVQKFVVQR